MEEGLQPALREAHRVRDQALSKAKRPDERAAAEEAFEQTMVTLRATATDKYKRFIAAYLSGSPLADIPAAESSGSGSSSSNNNSQAGPSSSSAAIFSSVSPSPPPPSPPLPPPPGQRARPQDDARQLSDPGHEHEAHTAAGAPPPAPPRTRPRRTSRGRAARWDHRHPGVGRRASGSTDVRVVDEPSLAILRTFRALSGCGPRRR